MRPMRFAILGIAMLALVVVTASAQPIISAKSDVSKPMVPVPQSVPSFLRGYPSLEHSALGNEPFLPAESRVRTSGDILFGKYEVLERLTAGGMAEAFKTRETASGELRFVKRVRVSSAHEKALRREAQIYNKLVYRNLPNVMRVYAIERDTDFMALVVDYADGGTLRTFAETNGPIPLGTAKSVADQIGVAIEALHGAGVIHRDIKPDNVLRHGGAWMLADFGIAKNVEAMGTTTFRAAGTEGYAPSEQIEGVEAHPTMDIYAFGKLLTFLLTGQTDRDRLHAGAWRLLIYRCTEHIPANRPGMADVIREVRSLPG